jgi:hypothetical protein
MVKTVTLCSCLPIKAQETPEYKAARKKQICSKTDWLIAFNDMFQDCFTERECKQLSKLTCEHLKDIHRAMQLSIELDKGVNPSRDLILLKKIQDKLVKFGNAATTIRKQKSETNLLKALSDYEQEVTTHRKWLRVGINKTIEDDKVHLRTQTFLNQRILDFNELKTKQRDQAQHALISTFKYKIYQYVCQTKRGESYILVERAFSSGMKTGLKKLFKKLSNNLGLIGEGRLFSSDDLTEKMLQKHY